MGYIKTMYQAKAETTPFITIYETCAVLNKLALEFFPYENNKRYKFEITKCGNIKIFEDINGCKLNIKSSRFNMGKMIQKLNLPLGKFLLLRYDGFYILKTDEYQRKYQNEVEKHLFDYGGCIPIYVDKEYEQF